MSLTDVAPSFAPNSGGAKRGRAIAVVAGVLAGGVICTSAVVSAMAMGRSVDRSADCRATYVTLEVAIEAYQAMEDELPASQSDLIDAGFLRESTTDYRIVDGSIVTAPGSACTVSGNSPAAQARGAPAPTTTPSPTTSVAATSPDDICMPLAVALRTLAGVGTDAGSDVVAELTAAAQTLQLAGDKATGDYRVEFETLAELASVMAEQIELLEAARIDTDANTASTIGELLLAMPGYIHAMSTRDYLAALLPTTASECDLPPTRADALRDVYAFALAVDAFLETDVATEPQFATLMTFRGMSEEMERTRVAASELRAEYARCLRDTEAIGVGDNGGCDALHDACDARDLLACDDLFYSSNAGSEYETFGATCGGRVSVTHEAWGGYCEELDP